MEIFNLKNMANAKKITEILVQLPFSHWLEILFYPVYLIWRMPVAWCRALWEARVFLKGGWSKYMGFFPQNAINGLFYRTQWHNLRRYGRRGVSPILGLGHYRLANWFHLSFFSSWAYASSGAITTLFGTIFWILSHTIWLSAVEPEYVIIALVILFFSTTSYAMAFAIQNYQILSFMWIPFGLYGVSCEKWGVACFAFLASSIAGLTPTILVFPIMLLIAISNQTLYPLLILIPAFVVILSRFIPLFSSNELYKSLSSIAKMIGLAKGAARYHRGSFKISIFSLYFLMQYSFGAFIFWYLYGEAPIILFAGIFIFLVNEVIFRIADRQSLILFVSSLYVMAIMKAPVNWGSLLVLWLALNPFGLFLSIQKIRDNSGVSKIIVRPPFDHTYLEQEMFKFLSPVNTGSRIYFSFEDPNGCYWNIFDGYRVIYELPLQVACQNEIHILPDWWAVSETNYADAPNCWGRSLASVIENCDSWAADFAVIYQENGSQIDDQWLDHFDCLSEFDFADHVENCKLDDVFPSGVVPPKFFLLRPKS